MSDLSISELIAEALRSSSIMQEEVEPIDHDHVAHEQMITAGRQLAQDIAAHYGLGFDEAWDALCYVPNHMLALLDSAYGWTVLSEYVAQGMGLTGSKPLVPSVH